MKEKLKILGVITARGGSKGIPGKNIKKLGNKPLIAFTIDVAKKSKLITHLIVSTDDEEIATVSKKYGALVPFMRPKELAEDSTPHLPVMQHAIAFMEEKLGEMFDYVVIFQPTSPFRTVRDIDETVAKLIDTGADSAVSVCTWNETSPIKAKRLEKDRVLPYFKAEMSTQRQELPEIYKRSSAVYAMKRDTIMNTDNPSELYGEYIVGHVVPSERSIDIDTSLDWIKAEFMLKELQKNGHSF